MARHSALIVFLIVGCGRGSGEQSPEVEIAKPTRVEEPVEANRVSPSNRADCEPKGAHEVDPKRVVELAQRALAAAEPSISLSCSEPEPACAATAEDGQQCRFSIRPHKGYSIVELWPQATSGGPVKLRYSVDDGLTKATLPARRGLFQSWAVAESVFCRGDFRRRSYGMNQRASIDVVSATCWNHGNREVHLEASEAHRVSEANPPAPVSVQAPAKQTLVPGATAKIELGVRPIRLPIKSRTTISILIKTNDGTTLEPVFAFDAGLRLPARSR